MQKLRKLRAFSESWTGTIIIVLLVIFFFIQAFTIPSGSMKNTLLVGDFLFVKKFSYGIPTPHIPWLEVPVLPDFDGDGHLIAGEGPKRGDIVVFRSPQNEKVHYVKRCVAKGGDEVLINGGSLFVRMSEGDEYMREHYADKIELFEGRAFVKEPFEHKGIHNDERVDMESTYLEHLAAGRFAMAPVFVSGLGELGASGGNAYYYQVPENAYFMMGDNRDHSSDSRFWGAVPYRLIVGSPWFSYFSWDKDYNIRWERIGRLVETLQSDERFIHEDLTEIDALE